MERNTEKGENEICTLQDMNLKMGNAHCRNWYMA
jgi:hypothetical protein